jgi:hypothetical protein
MSLRSILDNAQLCDLGDETKKIFRNIKSSDTSDNSRYAAGAQIRLRRTSHSCALYEIKNKF